MAVMTAPEARLYLRTISGTAEDSNIASMLTRADSVIASYLGFPAPTAGGSPTIEDTTYVLYMDGPGGQELRVPYLPIQSVTSLYDSADRDYPSSDLIAASDYELFGGEGLIRLTDTSSAGYFSTARRAIKLTAVIGWATIPEAIKHAAGLQVAYWFQGRDNVGRISVNQGGGSATFKPLSLLPEVKEALAPFRNASGWAG